VDDPKWHAFYGLLRVNAHVVERIGAAMERETGLPPTWFEVLANLSKGPLRMSDLAAKLTLSRGGATRLVARMEEEGLVEREVPKTDRRATYARLTDKGTEALHTAKPVHLATVGEMWSRHLDAEQAAVLEAAFAQVLRGNGIPCSDAE
jgi:DNA-binding MarR family transcriptional regulator